LHVRFLFVNKIRNSFEMCDLEQILFGSRLVYTGFGFGATFNKATYKKYGSA